MNDVSLRIALFEPQIPPNTGNIARTCAAFQLPLSLIEPLGFIIDDRHLRRAGLDYWPYVSVSVHSSFDAFKEFLPDGARIIGCSKQGGISLKSMEFHKGDVILLGREDNGLPSLIREQCDEITTVPMPGLAINDREGGVRSLNLSVAAALIAFEAGNQLKLW